jgi:hypothetical protein
VVWCYSFNCFPLLVGLFLEIQRCLTFARSALETRPTDALAIRFPFDVAQALCILKFPLVGSTSSCHTSRRAVDAPRSSSCHRDAAVLSVRSDRRFSVRKWCSPRWKQKTALSFASALRVPMRSTQHPCLLRDHQVAYVYRPVAANSGSSDSGQQLMIYCF